MLPVVNKYEIYPSVFPAKQESLVTVVPRERSAIFADGEEYSVTVIAVDSEPITETTVNYTVTAKDGVLSFVHPFLEEQEYKIVISKNESSVTEAVVYSLDEDLYSLLPMMGDLHSHSVRSDGRQDPVALAGYMRERGYDFYAMTDHHRYYPSEEVREALFGVKTGLVTLLGEEVHAPGAGFHTVHIGGAASVNEQYVKRREEFDSEILEYEARVPESVPQKHRERYARAMWASEHIHAVGGLAIFAHPFWRPNKSKHHNVSTEFAAIVLKSGLFDVYELIGAMSQQENNASVAFWNDLRVEGLNIPVVGSSDVHSVQSSPEFPWQRTVLFAEEKNDKSIIEAIKCGRSVAVEITGVDYTAQYRAYGSLRFVNYVQFLLRNYFAKTARLAYGEGVAIRAYAMGDAPKELVELQAAEAEKFTARFFGRAPAPKPSSELVLSKARWDEIHKDYQV